jgi:hypothetical protein
MKSGFEREIRPAPTVVRRGGIAPLLGVGFEVLPSNMVGIFMFLKFGQTQSEPVKPNQT